jgi:hypothetical protein
LVDAVDLHLHAAIMHVRVFDGLGEERRLDAAHGHAAPVAAEGGVIVWLGSVEQVASPMVGAQAR